MKETRFIENDGGRSKYFSGRGGDCVARSVAIASGKDYLEVYNRLAEGNSKQRAGKSSAHKVGKKTALHGINVKRKWFKEYMKELGFEWVPTMKVGSGCTTHLCSSELPAGRLVLALSRHYTAMIDGVIHDTYNPGRWDSRSDDGSSLKSNEFVLPGDNNKGLVFIEKRCVYGYWIKK